MPVIVPVGPPLSTTFGSLLLEAMQPWRNPDHDTYLLALSQMFEGIAQLVLDQDNDGDPDYVAGWASILDVDTCPTAYLPFLGEFVGVTIPTGSDDATARQIIRNESNQHRGTATAIISAAQRHLGGSQTVDLIERVAADGTADPWHFILVVRPEQVFSTVHLIQDVNSVKPAGIQWTLIETDGWIISEMEAAGYASLTALEAAFSSVTRLEKDLTP